MTAAPKDLTAIQKMIASNHFVEAEEAINAFLKHTPDSIDAYSLQASLLVKQHRLDAALDSIQRALAVCPTATHLYFDLGNIHFTNGNLKESIQAFRHGIALDPDNPHVHNNLGVVLKQMGNLEEAITAFHSALQLDPQLVLPYRNLGEIYRIQGHYESAIQSFKNAIRLDPNDANAHNGLGVTLATQTKIDEAIKHFTKAASLADNYKEAENNLGMLLSATSRPLEAIAIYEKTLLKNPDFVDGRVNLGSILIELGRFEEAITHLEHAIAVDPDHAMAFHHLGELALSDKYKFTETQLDHIQSIVSANDIRKEDRAAIRFTLAGIYEKKQLFDKAFETYRQANLINHEIARPLGMVFDADKHRKLIQDSIGFFSADFFADHSHLDYACQSMLPVFVIGMPRTGTTLVEQILASHPQGGGAGELAAIEDLSKQLQTASKSGTPYPNCLLDLQPDVTNTLSQKYLEQLKTGQSQAERIVDKTWYNFYFVGLISMLFPKAKIIHCCREPMDVIASCFFSNFNSIQWSWRLEDIGAYYQAYSTIMNHWRTTLPSEILDVSYEQLIGNQEGVIRNMLTFCELDWSDACLDFYNNKRAVHTASRVQVRKPIYSTSIGRWKNYESQLATLQTFLNSHD